MFINENCVVIMIRVTFTYTFALLFSFLQKLLKHSYQHETGKDPTGHRVILVDKRYISKNLLTYHLATAIHLPFSLLRESLAESSEVD